MKKQLVLLIIFLLGLSIGYSLGYFINSKPSNVGTFEDGWEAAKKRLTETAMIQPVDEAEIKSLMGLVEKIEPDGFVIKINAIHPLSPQNLDRRKIILNKETSIYKIVKKNEDEIQLEMKDFNNNLNNGQEMGPSVYKTIEINKNDLKIKDVVVVNSENNIKDLENFSANEVVVQYNP